MNKYAGPGFLELGNVPSLIHPLSCTASSSLGGNPGICSTLAMAPIPLNPQVGYFNLCNGTEVNCTTTEGTQLWQVKNQQHTNFLNSSLAESNNFTNTLALSDFINENLELTILAGIITCYLFLGIIHWLFSHVFPWSPLKSICEFVLSHLTFLLILPFFLLLLLGNSLFRFFISVALRLCYQRRFTILAGSDAFWAHNDVFAHTTNFYALYVLEGSCDIEKIRAKIQQKVIEKRSPYNGKLMYSRLKHTIVKKFGYYCCERIPESDFHINNHIKVINVNNLDQNENSTPKVDLAEVSLTESQVFTHIGKMCNVPLDASKPQWEILIIPHYTYDKDVENSENSRENTTDGKDEDIQKKKKYYGLIYRIHHSFMDGISAGYALQTAMADSPPRLAIDPMKKINIPFYKKIAVYVLLVVLGPVNLLKAILQSDTNSFHGPTLTGPKTVGWSRPVDLNALKKIKTTTKTSTTAILLSCLGSSIRSLAIQKKVPVPEKINAFITIAMMPYPNSHPQNRFTLSVLPIKIGLETCLGRLKSAFKSLCDLNCSPDIILSFYFIRIVGLFPSFLIKYFAELVHTTMLLSNVPGPAETTFMFDGDRLVDATCWSPIKGKIGIGMSLFSYAGRVRASMVADHVALPNSSDLKHMISAFENEVVKLGAGTEAVNENNIFHKYN